MLKLLTRMLPGDPHDSLNVILRLFRENGRPHWKRYAFALVAMAITAACTAASAYLIGIAINEAYVNRSYAGVVSVAIAIIVIFSVKGIATYTQALMLAKIGNQIVAENYRRMFDRLLQQDLAYFSDRHSSQFTARITFSARAASNVLNMLITTLGRDVLTLVGLTAVMIIQAPLPSLIGILVMAPAVLFVRHLVKRVRSIVQTEFTGGARIVESLQEAIQGLRVVKSLNLEDEMRSRMRADTEMVERAANKLARVANRSTPLMDALGGIAVGALLSYGGYEVLVFNTPPGQFISFIAAFLLAYEPGKRIARLNVDLSAALVGVNILHEILDAPYKDGHGRHSDLKVERGRIVFDKVSFRYRKEVAVLKGISFFAEPGRITALVGSSGGGKSTIFNLLLGFYDADGGEVSIDGQNVTAVSPASLRANIAYVGQDIFLFRGTIRANIAFGRLGASEAEIVAAAKAAYAHDFIVDLALGYDTPVGEHGLQLSGGQRQRIGVARALIRNVPIVLLDEPTASLDGKSELHVQQAIRRLVEGRTTLVIAHRLQTITHADVIHVLEKGEIVESGRHDDLLRQGGRYAHFYKLQFGDKQGENIPLAGE